MLYNLKYPAVLRIPHKLSTLNVIVYFGSYQIVILTVILCVSLQNNISDGSDKKVDKTLIACSRRRNEMEATRSTVSLHCTRNGDYEPLQCDNGMCWCAQPRTGQPIVAPVPEDDMKLLPCYSESVIGEKYLRQCESVVHAMALLHKEQSDHGTNFLGNPVTFCDYDGSFGPFQIKNGIAYCTDRAGEILGAWQVVANEMGNMNCNCARDSQMYFPERGMTVTEVCLSNGNYQPNQRVGDVYYCVDTDGYPIELLDDWPADRCASHG